MITIVTKKYCPYCIAAKQFLNTLGKEYTEVDVSSDRDTYEWYIALSNMKTVPQIFDGEPSSETLVGGYDDMNRKYAAGEIFQK